MTKFRVPLAHPKPDIERFMQVVIQRHETDRPPLVEYIVDGILYRPIVENLMGRKWADYLPDDRKAQEAYWDNYVAFWHCMGYDFVRLEMGLPFPSGSRIAEDSAEAAKGRMRGWAETGKGPIQSREDYEKYPWPKIEDEHFWPYEHISRRLPEGMGMFSCHGGGIFEHVSRLFGYETLCLMLYDDPGLVRDVTDRVGELLLAYHRRLCRIPGVVAIFQGDDMGFRSGPLIGADHMKEYFLSWHKRFAASAHESGRKYFLHSCGNLEQIMEAIISDVGIDAKHSYEDAIVPVAEFKKRYGSRIGILGGIDVDVLARRSPEEVRAHVRKTIEECNPGGGWAVGSGNSIPSYIPLENYLTMLDESLA
ncbi:MAG TPA: uroporphyrinogen decarboxylase family protein [Candidatus Brocadiia bacterium]|nr:uroporphyrinogen decarboxylase family protein [Candidatus Brocadiia bacterium]